MLNTLSKTGTKTLKTFNHYRISCLNICAYVCFLKLVFVVCFAYGNCRVVAFKVCNLKNKHTRPCPNHNTKAK